MMEKKSESGDGEEDGDIYIQQSNGHYILYLHRYIKLSNKLLL